MKRRPCGRLFSSRPRIVIDPLSGVALKLKPKFQGTVLSNAATGFVVLKDARPFLITNWHVVAEKMHSLDCTLINRLWPEPDRLSMLIHHLDGLGKWIEAEVLLLRWSNDKRLRDWSSI